MALKGTWDLKSCKANSVSGKAFLPYGEHPKGQLIYTAEGKVVVLLMNTSRVAFQSEDLAHVTTEEKATAFDSFDAYSGAYVINESEQTVTHKIEAGRVPNWVGKEHLRYYSVSDNTLTLLSEPFYMSGEEWKVEVVWKRVN